MDRFGGFGCSMVWQGRVIMMVEFGSAGQGLARCGSYIIGG